MTAGPRAPTGGASTLDATKARPQRVRRPTLSAILAVGLLLSAVGLSLVSEAPPVSITIPWSGTAIADGDLDGDPATGAWGDALSIVIPLENGAASPYGSATMWAKHDGTRMFLRIDGSIDIPWASPTGNHFWLGFVVSTSGTSHHGAGAWDGVFFGLWDGTDHAPIPTYPPPAVDTNGFARPPAKDGTQDALGRLRYAGAAAPYTFTAEWRFPLSSGDTNDTVYVADGATPYNFFVTTDSNGGGSSGGAIVHRGMTNLNTMRFATAGPPNAPPVVDLTTPNGGERWSAGSTQTVRWNMSDPEDATSALRVWLNYSLNDGASWSPIAGAQGLTGLACPCTYSWVTPGTGSTLGRVRAEVRDTQAAPATDMSAGPFTLDATAPSVTGTSPTDGATGVLPTAVVDVTFSEAMRQSSAEQAFSLRRGDTGAYLSGSFAWAGPMMTFTPGAQLAQGVTFTGRVNATARDTSDPGNPLAAPYTFSFTTADVTPPTVASVVAVPPVQESGGTVNVTATVTDNGMVGGVWVEITDPTLTLLGNYTMARDPSTGLYYYAAIYRTTGTYGCRVVARDAAGNWAEGAGSFLVQDTTPPTITHTPPAGGTAGIPVPVRASAADNDAVSSVWLNYTDVTGTNANVTMAWSPPWYVYTIPGQPTGGTIDYFIWAVDRSGNAARTATYTIVIIAVDTTPPSITSISPTPPVQDLGQTVNVTAVVTDDVEVASVSVEVTDPTGALLGNFTMARWGATDTYYLEGLYTSIGTYDVTVWANDTSGNAASAAGTFEIVDRVRPAFVSTSASPDPQEVPQAVDIRAEVTDNDRVASVQVQISDPGGTDLGNFTMAIVGVDTYGYSAGFLTLGTLTYTVWATDPSGNAGSATGQFTLQDTTPPVVSATGGGTYWVGTTVTLDASNSTDNSGIANVTWTFDYDGSPVTRYGAVVTFAFGIVGTYDINVTVEDLAGLQGYGQLSVEIVTDTTPPPAPVIEDVVPTAYGCLLVTWQPVDDPGLEGYRLFRWNSTSGGFDLTAELPSSATSWEDCGLAYGEVYTYRMTAFDDYGNESPPSAMRNGRTTAPPAPIADLLPIILAVVVALVLVLALVLAIFARRKRRSEPEPPTEMPPPPPA